MACELPTANDIRKYLRGYCVTLESNSTVTGTTVTDSAVVTGIDTRTLETEMRISGTGIPDYTTIQSIDSVGVNGQLTMSDTATADGTDITITVEYYTEMTNEWIGNRRDRFVIPYIERITGLSISEESEITEYYSGNGGSLLVLNRRPINEITAISYVNIPDEQQTGNLLLSIELIGEEGVLKSKVNFNEGSYNPIFAKGKDNIKITYKYGYAETPCDIVEAITIMLAKKVLMQIGARTGGGSVSQSSYSRNFGNRGKYTDIINEMDQEFYSIIQKYTTGVVGA